MKAPNQFGHALAALALVVSAGCITPKVHNTPVDHIDFETSYRPLLAEALRIADSGFLPRSIAVVDGYLVVELGEPGKPPAEEVASHALE